ncbi:ubiquitin-like domain-containing protein CIP73 isoform X2 [Lotus japonicus]|uniref:ubiquitin-like domain-containing protein CIP73 isoform X2 n=1 Tax=Lotus japonicus TaxID=34305 RepID=UPI00258AAFDB|nr:ubiquitin-like domain-containing protein CIP73 isoform X2 [Lotus japonicus]
MADQCSNEGSTSANTSAQSSDSTVQLNIKTLDSRIFSFQVDNNMPVSSFKEKIANEIGVPVSQQRLIFRGKVLKDEHVLSEYHVENGHTLHLVERQPNQSQASGTRSAEPTGTNGNDTGSGAPRNRVGQISHSVVLGTFNVGEQGEGIVQDLTRVIGTVLNTIANGGQSTVNVPNATQTSSAPPGNETEGVHAVRQNLAGNQAPSGQTFPGLAFQSMPQVVQIPMAAGAIPLPSLNSPIPDSLNTLSEFINSMQQALSQNGYRPNLSSTNLADQRVELPSNAQGLPTLEALSTVLHRAEQLLGSQAVAALSHIAGRLEQEGTSTDLGMRGQIQSESMQIGLAMQHLGALLLELGRTMLTLRMGQSYAESVVNAGPAVYISPSGPNPIMVQPFPLQTSSLFGGPAPSSTPASLGTIGIGSAPRNVNIHIHAGTSLAPIVSAIGSRPNNGEGTRSEHRNEPGSGDSGSTRVLPVRNAVSATLPSHTPGVGIAGSTQTGSGVSTSQPPHDSAPFSSVLAEIHSRLRNSVGNMQGNNTVPSGQMESSNRDLSSGPESRPPLGNEQQDTMENGCEAASASSVGGTSETGVEKFLNHNQPQTEATQTYNNEERDVLVDKFVSSSSSNQDLPSCSSGETIVKSEKVQDAPSVIERRDGTEPAKAAPLGLGVGGLERKRRTRPLSPLGKGADDGSSGSSINQSQQTRTDGQHLLQTLASHGSAVNLRNANRTSQQPLPSSSSQVDVAGLMSQLLHSPALNGLLEGVSQQTGVDSPDGLRNTLQQFTQSPQMMNTVNQIVQQVGSQDMGRNMFAGMERGQGGGIDLSSMFQQMMPIVSRALGGGNPPSLFSATEPEPGAPYRDESSDNRSIQLDLQSVAERIDRLNPPSDVFRAVAENAVELSGSGSASSDLLDELCSNESLAREYVDMLRYDVNQLLEGQSESDKS